MLSLFTKGVKTTTYGCDSLCYLLRSPKRWGVNPLVLSCQIPDFSVLLTTYRHDGDGYGGNSINKEDRIPIMNCIKRLLYSESTEVDKM